MCVFDPARILVELLVLVVDDAMETLMKVLAVPPAAMRDEQSVEVLRVWIAERGLHCCLCVGRYAADGIKTETRAWGVIIADAVQHIADALASEGYGARDELLSAVIESFEAEIASPTSGRTGEFTVRPA